MGNIGSQTGNINQQLEEKWNYSFPRAQTHLYQHKVFPEKDLQLKLRSTSNGEILQSGGTLSGRQNQNRTVLTNNKDEIKRCDSEPDLRFSSQQPPQQKDAIRTKKKYKAPSPPKMRGENTRKPRLFKTRLESNQNNSSPIVKPLIDNDKKKYENERKVQETSRPKSLELEDELKFATSNLKCLKVNNPTNNSIVNKKIEHKDKLKTLDHNINNAKKYKKILAETSVDHINKSSSEPQTPAEKKVEPKTFYFGMDEPIRYTVDESSNLDYLNHLNQDLTSSFESDLSSGPETSECQAYKAGIDLKLRPILPKKQLEIPRFSPAAAWRLLSSMDSPIISTTASEDCPILIEDRIEKLSRPPPPTAQVARFSNDKSGDSGISGDAGPVGYEDNAEIAINSNNNKISMLSRYNNNQHRISWTPQQDLEDDSSMEEYGNEKVTYKQSKQAEYQTRPHVFSLSLPRENHLASHIMDKSYNKLKRSMSGVLGNFSTTKNNFTQPNLEQEQNDNWLLSKSAANSLTNCFNSLEMRHSQKSDDSKQLLVPMVKQNGGRVMYLPESDLNHRQSRATSKDNSDSRRYKSRSMERLKSDHKLTVYSKSCDNLNANIQQSSGPEDLQDSPAIKKESHAESSSKKQSKKFTFQSTIRQIERKIIAEKLSKEAERKEKQRLRELEVMRKVEEEFQQKRDREKAAIRQQLRLYSLDDPAWTSLPPNIQLIDNDIPTRTEPDGADSSPTTSSPAPQFPLEKAANKVYQKNKRNASKFTRNKSNFNGHEIKSKVLSEYKQPQRDYKEYRGSTKYYKAESSPKQTTVHPQVKCNMPKSKGKGYSQSKINNHRSGVRSAESSHSEDSQYNLPKLFNKNYFVTRS